MAQTSPQKPNDGRSTSKPAAHPASDHATIISLKPGLYLVATPIGNLRDITLRALDILNSVDAIACEDTRITGKLLQHYGIQTPTLPYHDHNAPRQRPALLARLAAGARVALVSDAGTPLISDPGYKLVRNVVQQGGHVEAIPGASALLTGLSVAGLPTDRFLFAGFPPAKTAARQRFFAALANIDATLVFYESGPRLAASLSDMQACFGDRPAAVARELTKRFEDVVRDRLPSLVAEYGARPAPKGEIVVILGPSEDSAEDHDIDALLRTAMEGQSLKDAAALVATATGGSKRDIYQRALALARQRPDTS